MDRASASSVYRTISPIKMIGIPGGIESGTQDDLEGSHVSKFSYKL